MTLVADTSALVSLACADDETILELFFGGYDVVVPSAVLDELEEMARYEDPHGRAASDLLERDDYDLSDLSSSPDIPLDAGENATVTLANDRAARFCYCDEFNRLAIVHASLVDSRLVTTPRLLEAFVVHDDITREKAAAVFESISAVRSWEYNAYVQQTRQWFEHG